LVDIKLQNSRIEENQGKTGFDLPEGEDDLARGGVLLLILGFNSCNRGEVIRKGKRN